MKEYRRPARVFFVGQLFILGLFLFFPLLADKVADLWAETWDFPLWGWEWVVLSARLFIVVIAELLVLYWTARAFMAVRDGNR